jgi:hypothetical protein
MSDQDPVPEHERSHALRRSVLLAVAWFYAITIAWASFMAVADK